MLLCGYRDVPISLPCACGGLCGRGCRNQFCGSYQQYRRNGSSAGVPGPLQDFDLQNSITYGGKFGYFPGHSWYGIEGEILNGISLPRDDGIEPQTTAATLYHPMVGAGSIHTVRMEEPGAAIGEVEDCMAPFLTLTINTASPAASAECSPATSGSITVPLPDGR